MYICKATYSTQDHWSTTVTKKSYRQKFFRRATSDTPKNLVKLCLWRQAIAPFALVKEELKQAKQAGAGSASCHTALPTHAYFVCSESGLCEIDVKRLCYKMSVRGRIIFGQRRFYSMSLVFAIDAARSKACYSQTISRYP